MYQTIFSHINTVAEVKEVANVILKNFQEAYNNRIAELRTLETASEKPAVKEVAKAETKTEVKTPKTAKTVAKKAAAKTTAKATKTASKKETEIVVAASDMAKIKELGLSFQEYSEKSLVLRGNTKPIYGALKKEYRCKYNENLKGGEGVIFRKEEGLKCAKVLGIEVA